MRLGSNKNFVALDFPFTCKSQEKYGITSSATSKSGVAKSGAGRRKRFQETEGTLYVGPVYFQPCAKGSSVVRS